MNIVKLYIDSETAGEHGRGEIVHTRVVAQVNVNDEFAGNWTVATYHGPESRQAARIHAARLTGLLFKEFTLDTARMVEMPSRAAADALRLLVTECMGKEAAE